MAIVFSNTKHGADRFASLNDVWKGISTSFKLIFTNSPARLWWADWKMEI